jgi:hypothetical protein
MRTQRVSNYEAGQTVDRVALGDVSGHIRIYLQAKMSRPIRGNSEKRTPTLAG